MLTERILGLIGVGLCVLVLGCGPGGGETPDENGQTGNGTEADAHGHSEEGPHGGRLVELRGEYHVELLHDEATHTVTIHILDATGKQEIAIGQTEIAFQVFQDSEYVTHTLAAVGGEATASEFSIADEKLCDLLLHSEELKGRVNVTIDGKDYVGMIDHHGHDHTGHAHGEPKANGHDEDGEEGHVHGADGDGHDEDGDEEHVHGADDDGHDEDGDEEHVHDSDGNGHDEDGDADHNHAEHGDGDHDGHEEDGHGHDEDSDEGHSPNHDGDGHDEDTDADHGDHQHE